MGKSLLSQLASPMRLQWIVAIATLCVALFGQIEYSYLRESDYATQVQLGYEVFRQGRLFPDWLYISEFYTIPTISPCIFLGLVYYLTGSIWVSCMLVSMCFAVVMVFSMNYMLAALNIQKRYVLFAAALMFPFMSWFFYSLYPITAFVVIGCYVRLLDGRSSRFEMGLRILLPLVAFSQGIGTMRLTSNLYLPLAAWVIWPVVKGMFLRDLLVLKYWFSPKRRAFYEPLLWSFMNFAGVIVAKMVWRPADVWIAGDNLSFSDLTAIPQNLLNELRGLASILNIQIAGKSVVSFDSVHFYLLLLALSLLLYFVPKMATVNDYWHSVIVLSALPVAAIVIIVSLTDDLSSHSNRYFYPLLPFIAVCFALLLEYSNRFRLSVGLISLLVVAIVLLQVRPGTFRSRFDRMIHPPYEADATTLVDYMHKHSLSKGYATYWNGPYNSMSTNGEIEIAPLWPSPPSNFSPMGFNTRNYNYTPEFADGNVFLLLTSDEEKWGLEDSQIAELLRTAEKLESVLKYQVYLFKDFNPFLLRPNAILPKIHPDEHYSISPLMSEWIKRGEWRIDGTSIIFEPGRDRVLFGPYVSMPVGAYELELHYEYLNKSSESQLGVDFDMIGRSNSGSILNFLQVALPRDRNTLIIPDIKIEVETSKIEFRFWLRNDTERFRIERLKVTRKH